jgi:hypothetical protein
VVAGRFSVGVALIAGLLRTSGVNSLQFPSTLLVPKA